MGGRDDIKIFAGIATEDIQSGKFGYLQYCGEICEDDIILENNEGYNEMNLKLNKKNKFILAKSKENIMLICTK